MSAEEATIALLDIKSKLDQCGPSYIIRATLRAKARELAAQFVDPTWEPPQPPRKGLADEREIIDGVPSPF